MQTKHSAIQTSFLALLLATCGNLWAQDFVATPLPTQHPLLGSWKLKVPETNCFETYTLRADGTMQVSSGAQKSESVFQIDEKPNSKGFYKWVDKLVKDNGKPDCMGFLMEVGDVSTNYIALHETGKLLLMCDQDEIETCIGPLVRQEDL